MVSKVKIELRPYDALAILTFCREYINDSNKHNPWFTAIHEAVSNYEEEIFNNLSTEQLADAKLECNVNYIADRHPPKSNT